MPAIRSRSAERVLLVGSVPLATAEEVFRTTTEILGEHARRLPDGETGDRLHWIDWQLGVMARAPQFELVPPDASRYPPLPQLKLRSGASAAEVVFGDLGYAAAARGSYRVFERLRAEGVIRPEQRFQVSLPTPLAPVSVFIDAQDQAALEPIYEARLLAELDEICAAIPHVSLSIQWDTAVEFAILEDFWPTFLGHCADVEQQLIERLVRVGRRVPRDVELGYHFCYGDFAHRHFTEPEDATRLVTLANGLGATLDRPLDWLHMPVPRDRSDAAYFAPLRNLSLQADTELYLGLVHYTDGLEGACQRIRAARRFVPPFGVATECGLGRRPPQTIRDLLQLHVDAAAWAAEDLISSTAANSGGRK